MTVNIHNWFYLLPKICKRLFNVPSRTVISSNSTETENISAYLDYHLKPLVFSIPHILIDTRGFLCGINQINNISEDTILVSFDVVGIYLNIPHDEGIETMTEYLNLVTITLKNNCFESCDLKHHNWNQI